MGLAAHCTPIPREKLHGAVRGDGNDSNESDGMTSGQADKLKKANFASHLNRTKKSP
jgi:hypothetical protein